MDFVGVYYRRLPTYIWSNLIIALLCFLLASTLVELWCSLSASFPIVLIKNYVKLIGLDDFGALADLPILGIKIIPTFFHTDICINSGEVREGVYSLETVYENMYYSFARFRCAFTSGLEWFCLRQGISGAGNYWLPI